MTSTFRNEPFLDFSVASVRAQFQRALDELNKWLPLKVGPIINGEEILDGASYQRPDPSDVSQTIGTVFMADEGQVLHALRLAIEARERWEDTPASDRIEVLRKAASLMRSQRLELAAMIVREAGKPWKESDADVCEAIDFCDYYALEMEGLVKPRLTERVPGEDNVYFYQPRGVAVVVSPWNFPLAITCGMAVAALVTGNTVLIKPSRQTTAIASRLVKILLEAGIPKDVLALVPGSGAQIGNLLVEHPEVHMIAFTGSREVGLDIVKKAAEVKPGQRHIKKVIAELGGKNAIIIDEDADLDEAVKGVLYSAFGYSGQKCSACSRVIAVGDSYEVFLERLKHAVADIITGASLHSATLVGPVIDEASAKKDQCDYRGR